MKITQTAALLHLLFAVILLPMHAQETLPPAAQHWDVFIDHHDRQRGTADLIFIDIASGAETIIPTHGHRHTLLDSGVIYFDSREKQVKLATPDGASHAHPFITLPADAQRVDWAVSADRQTIAWTLTQADGSSLQTATFTAHADGQNIREVLVDGPREAIRALPIAFSSDKTELYLDVHPDGISHYTPYTQYAGLFALDLTDGTVRSLPGEPACFCAAGFGAGMFLRLPPSPDASGVAVHIHSTAGGAARVIPAIPHSGYTQASPVLIDPAGSRAVYALSQVEAYRTAQQQVLTLLVQVDLLALQQTVIGSPITRFVQPLGWTAGGSALLFTSRERNGTWKIDLNSGKLHKVAEAAYLGPLPHPTP